MPPDRSILAIIASFVGSVRNAFRAIAFASSTLVRSPSVVFNLMSVNNTSALSINATLPAK